MKALYRKYRPLKLADVIGEPQVTDALENSLKTGKISHAYLFVGPRGCGKTSVARIFAHEINDFKYEVEDNYIDIIEIDAASNTGVENIRELKERAVVAPTEGKYKVYIIDEIHMLSKSAFNALLKTLEEPPKHVIFIMATTDVYKVLPTIISRSQVYNFKLVGEEVMLPYLQKIAKSEKIKIDDAALKVIVRRGGGSFRDTISLLDQISSISSEKITEDMVVKILGLPKDQAIDGLLEAYENGELSSISDRLRELLNSGARPETIAEETITRILKNPLPSRLDLLKTLPSVSAPFAEAKLLLALTSQLASTPIPATGPASSAEAGPADTRPSSLVKKPLRDDGRAPAGPASARNASALTTSSPPNFNWNGYVERITAAVPTLEARLKECAHNIEGTILKIYPPKKIFANILKSKNNLEVLTANLPENLKLEICDPDEMPKDLSPNSKLSDIMGPGIKEVEDDGTNPF